MKKAVVTISCGEFYLQLAAITHPTLEAYARKIGADFIAWREFSGHTIAHYQKLEIGKLLNQYDRVLFLDTDMLVRDDTPDLFELVPEGELGIFDEGRYLNRQLGALQFMTSIGYDPHNWDGNYYNTGVMVLSKNHQNLFAAPAKEWDHCKEQSYLNVTISLLKAKVFSLPYRFNRCYYMDWETGDDRLDAYVIHYAGIYGNSPDAEFLNLVAHDRAAWEQARGDYRFPRHLAFVVKGGLSEQLAVEPALRYARETLFPHDDLVVVAPRPQLYAHLGLPAYSQVNQIPRSTTYRLLFNRVSPKWAPAAAIESRQFHPVGLAALTMLGVEPTAAAKRPKLLVDSAAADSVARKCQPHQPSELVVVHAAREGGGSGDEWRLCAEALLKRGLNVALVGNRADGDLAAIDFSLDSGLDLRDQLSVDEVVALVSQAKAVVSNDSAVTQIAGAFDNRIAVYKSARHPDYVLPWRESSQSWRATSGDKVDELAAFVGL